MRSQAVLFARNRPPPNLVDELVPLKGDVIVASGAWFRPARHATTTIPIVMTSIGDPVPAVASLARPGGNITGLATIAPVSSVC
jgi:putative tryptophan/tyrosine transport system substrate-binding protein